MNRMYVLCSFIVLGIFSVCSSCLLYTEVNTLKNSLTDASSITDELNNRNNSLERALDELEQSYESIDSNENGNEIAAYPGIPLDDYNDVDSAESTLASEEYVVMLQEQEIKVYYSGDNEPVFSLEIEKSLLTDEQISLLEKGIHIQDISEVYYLLESYSS